MIKYKNEEEHVRHIHRQKQQREREKNGIVYVLFFVEDNVKENSEIQLDIFFVRVLMLF